MLKIKQFKNKTLLSKNINCLHLVFSIEKIVIDSQKKRKTKAEHIISVYQSKFS